MKRLLVALLLAWSAPALEARQPMTLKAAYDAGLVTVSVEIAAQDKRGDRLQLQLKANDTPLTITLSTEPISLAMEKPFDKVDFRAAAAQKIDLTPTRPASLTVNQLGEYRFVSAKFETVIDEGKPAFIGSGTKDFVK